MRVVVTAVLVPFMVSYALVAGTAIMSELVVPTNWWPWPLGPSGPYRGTRLLDDVYRLGACSPGRYALFVSFTAVTLGCSEILRRLWGCRWASLFPAEPGASPGDERRDRYR